MKTILFLLFSAGMSFILLTNCNSSKAVVVGQGEGTNTTTTNEYQKSTNSNETETPVFKTEEVKRAPSSKIINARTE